MKKYDKAHNDWAKENIKPEDQMVCRNCGRIVDLGWCSEDHKGLCGPCLQQEVK